MLVAMKKGQLVMADSVNNGEDCYCPGCLEPVVLRRGRFRLAHFAHRPGSQCQLGEGETPEHLLGKRQLFERAKECGYRAELEVYLSKINQRPDLLLTSKDRQLAIEFQCSPLSLQRLRERNAGYRRCGIQVHWLLGAPYLRRHLRPSKVAQFTQWVAGQPGLLFWDTRVGRLVVKRDYERCSYIRRPLANRGTAIKYQSQRLNTLQYGRPSVALRPLLLAIPEQRPLAACPLVCHDTLPTWPIMAEPLILWRIRVIVMLYKLPIFHFWRSSDWSAWLQKVGDGQWLGYGCVDPACLRQQLLADFTQDLLKERVIIACGDGYLLFQYPRWFESITQKFHCLGVGF